MGAWMSWDTKQNGRRYYYRARKIHGRCVKVYVGAGPVAVVAAGLDVVEREDRTDAKPGWEEGKQLFGTTKSCFPSCWSVAGFSDALFGCCSSVRPGRCATCIALSLSRVSKLTERIEPNFSDLSRSYPDLHP